MPPKDTQGSSGRAGRGDHYRSRGGPSRGGPRGRGGSSLGPRGGTGGESSSSNARLVPMSPQPGSSSWKQPSERPQEVQAKFAQGAEWTRLCERMAERRRRAGRYYGPPPQQPYQDDLPSYRPQVQLLPLRDQFWDCATQLSWNQFDVNRHWPLFLRWEVDRVLPPCPPTEEEALQEWALEGKRALINGLRLRGVDHPFKGSHRQCAKVLHAANVDIFSLIDILRLGGPLSKFKTRREDDPFPRWISSVNPTVKLLLTNPMLGPTRGAGQDRDDDDRPSETAGVKHYPTVQANVGPTLYEAPYGDRPLTMSEWIAESQAKDRARQMAAEAAEEARRRFPQDDAALSA